MPRPFSTAAASAFACSAAWFDIGALDRQPLPSLWRTRPDMILRVNLEFSGDTDIAAADSPHGTVPPVAYWQSRRAEFQSTKDLKDIATDHGVVSPTQNANWMTWLSSFGDHTDSTTAHEK